MKDVTLHTAEVKIQQGRKRRVSAYGFNGGTESSREIRLDLDGYGHSIIDLTAADTRKLINLLEASLADLKADIEAQRDEIVVVQFAGSHPVGSDQMYWIAGHVHDQHGVCRKRRAAPLCGEEVTE